MTWVGWAISPRKFRYICFRYFLWSIYMFRKLFSHCGKITYNFPCIHTVRRRKMFKTLIFQECFISLKIWQTTFSTTNSGGKICRKKIRPRAPVQKAKLEQKTRKSKTYKWNCQSSSIKSFQRRSRDWNWHWNHMSALLILDFRQVKQSIHLLSRRTDINIYS